MTFDKPVVFVVDEDVSVRESLELLVGSAGWHAQTFRSGQEFLSRPRVTAPSCLVLDVALPDLCGLDLQRLVADWTDMPIIFMSGCGDVATIVRAMKAGALEFLTKPVRDDVILGVVREALERSTAVLERKAEMLRLRECYASLSPRQREVMALVVSGRLNREVGGELGISEITVKAHRSKMMRKMQARSLADLIKMAHALRSSHRTPHAA